MTARQQAFVRYYVQHWNAHRAALQAGYSAASARQHGVRCTSNVNIKLAIIEWLREHDASVEQDINRVREEWRRLAFSDIGDICSVVDGKLEVKDLKDLTIAQRACIQEIRQTKDGLIVKLHSKVAALESLAKHSGMFLEPDDRTLRDVTPKDDDVDRDDNQDRFDRALGIA